MKGAPEGEKYIPDALEGGKVRILALTWNMHGKKEPENFSDLLRIDDIHHDIYIIGTQECSKSIAKSTLYPSK